MRDPKRIERMLALLEGLWKLESDLRFGQLLVNIKYFDSDNGNKPISMINWFNIEDDKMEIAILEMKKHIEQKVLNEQEKSENFYTGA
jgi:uncharacterized protein YihD (DUF1040 family)